MELAPARWRDSKLLFEWRQADEAEAEWFEGKPVTWAQHHRWYKGRYNNPLVEMWVAWHEKGPVGQVRVDSNGEISYSVDAVWRGKGLGPQMVEKAIQLSQHPRIKASVDHANEAGIRTLLKVGFEYRPDVDFFLLRR